MAKLRMLEFYHNFIDRFIDRKNFELIQMDTDSLYMAISQEKLSQLAKPGLKTEYLRSSWQQQNTPTEHLDFSKWNSGEKE